MLFELFVGVGVVALGLPVGVVETDGLAVGVGEVVGETDGATEDVGVVFAPASLTASA